MQEEGTVIGGGFLLLFTFSFSFSFSFSSLSLLFLFSFSSLSLLYLFLFSFSFSSFCLLFVFLLSLCPCHDTIRSPGSLQRCDKSKDSVVFGGQKQGSKNYPVIRHATGSYSAELHRPVLHRKPLPFADSPLWRETQGTPPFGRPPFSKSTPKTILASKNDK